MSGMSVKLVSVQKPEQWLLDEGVESVSDLIAFCARVSNPSNQYNNETADKLIVYLKKHKHWSPFEMVNVCLAVDTPRDIGRQMLRHRSLVFQEASQRYQNTLQNSAFILREARLQDEKNRQNSVVLSADEAWKLAEWETRQREVIDLASKHYEWAIKNGIAKECARVVLPEGNTMSRMYVNGNIRSWIHYLDARLDLSTQTEHRALALGVAEAINTIFPGGWL